MAYVDGFVGERRVETDGIVAPGDPGAGPEDKTQTERQHDYGELRLAYHSSQDDGVQCVSERGGNHDRDQSAHPIIECTQCDHALYATNPPSIMMSPWAKFTISVAL